MRPWNEIIAEARDRNKEKAERQRRLKIAKINVKGSAALDKGKKPKKEPYGPGNPSFDLAAKREAEEEMGIPNIDKIKLPGGTRQTLEPKFVFKHKFEDNNSRAWVYTYYIPWHTALTN